ncbi:MAG: hypothetical protein CMJ78_20180 [Planctomycetaceae bacterium]|nr:hypothetical protein [Planctomycetaceae bacterium]
MKQLIFSIMIAATVAVLSPTSGFAEAKFNRVLDIGKKAPYWSKLYGVDGKLHSLGDLKESKAVVVVFTCNHCPVAQAYEERLIQLTKEYKSKGVTVVAISCSNLKPDRLKAMKERAKKRGFNFAYLADPAQKWSFNYGATATPQAFLLDKERKIAYMGAIDDSMIVEDVEEHYLKDAIDSLLAGKEIEITETRQFGCGIEYEPVAVSVVDPDGFKRSIERKKGKVVLVDFWATWCIPCRKMFPHTVEFTHQFGSEDFAAVSISFDDPEAKPTIEKFLTVNRATFTNFICKFGGEDKSYEVYKVPNGLLPHYKLYDQKGKLRHVFEMDPFAKKQFTSEDIEKKIKELLKEETSSKDK